MKVLVIGSGAREHAICWKLRQSPRVTALFCAPGNPGIGACATNLNVSVDDVPGLVRTAIEHHIDLTVVGPELPLSLGVVDAFEEKGLRIFGPSRAAAELEASKSFAKEIMREAGVPTARAGVFSTRQETERYIAAQGLPIVIKADGLASGKGVVVCHTQAELDAGLELIFEQLKPTRVVVEQFLSGKEASFIVATDGIRIVPLATSHDYKRLKDHHQGPNTGGMGSVSPTPVLSDALQEQIIPRVIEPMLACMRARGTPFKGFLYAGLMISPMGEIGVLEFNARLGDPETQVIMRRMESDLYELLWALTEKDAALPEVRWNSATAVCVVLASAGYPENPTRGDEITGLELVEMVPGGIVFHAGTALDERGRMRTHGGRVLSVTALGNTVLEAASQAYKVCDLIQFKGRQVRRDIGQ